MLGSTRKQTSEDCTLSLNSISIATVHPISLSGKGKRKQGEIKWLWGPRMKIREWESENEKQINLAPEGDPEQSSQQCTGGRLGSSKPCNDNIRTFFSYAFMMFKNSPWTEKKQDGSNSGGLGHIPSCFKAAAPPDYPSEGLAWDDDPAGDPDEASGSQICDCSQRRVKGKGPASPACSMDLSFVSTASLPSRSPTWEGLTLLPQRPEMYFPKRLQCQVVCVFGANSGGFATKLPQTKPVCRVEGQGPPGLSPVIRSQRLRSCRSFSGSENALRSQRSCKKVKVFDWGSEWGLLWSASLFKELKRGKFSRV